MVQDLGWVGGRVRGPVFWLHLRSTPLYIYMEDALTLVPRERLTRLFSCSKSQHGEKEN
jgi:hypothetical protein